MRTVTVQPGQTINLGYQYDNESTQVVFPNSIISQFTDNFGTDGVFAIWYRRSGDALGYPIGNPLVVYAGGKVTWLLTEADLANPGSAQVQLRYVVDDVYVMSQVFAAYISDSVDIGDDVPEPMEAWADAITEAASTVGTLSGLLDVDVAAPTNGQVLKYNGTSGKWENANESGGGGGADELNDLSDVSLSSVTDDQFLRYDSTAGKWVNESVSIPSAVSPYTSNPAALGTASPGSSDDYARGDHVHPKPTSADIGAIAAPSSPATGAFLVWNGSAWVAQTLSTWQGGNY